MTTLEVDAITNSSDETLTESNSISERIIAVAGNQLKEELSTTVKGKPGTTYTVLYRSFNLMTLSSSLSL